jgi:hypothetical protein
MLAGIMVNLLVSCTPSSHEVELGWRRALQMDLGAAHEQWLVETRRGQYASNAGAIRALGEKYVAIYRRWNLPMDPVSQGLMAYSVALWTRVDQHELSWTDAGRLQERLSSDIAHARPTLPAFADSPASTAALVQWWAVNWEKHHVMYAALPTHPIRCATGPEATIVCE